MSGRAEEGSGGVKGFITSILNSPYLIEKQKLIYDFFIFCVVYLIKINIYFLAMLCPEKGKEFNKMAGTKTISNGQNYL